jgi:putative thioredoxin
MDEIEEIKKRKREELIRKFEEDKMETKIKVDDNNFKENVIEKSKEIPVIVDFWATWCMPCNMLSPVLEKLTEEYQGKFILAEANVDESRVTAQQYGIMSIPAVKMFKNGEVTNEFVGALPEQVVRDWIEKSLES